MSPVSAVFAKDAICAKDASCAKDAVCAKDNALAPASLDIIRCRGGRGRKCEFRGLASLKIGKSLALLISLGRMIRSGKSFWVDAYPNNP